MEIRKVNVERFDAAFRAMLKNAGFSMDERCGCLVGSYERFVGALPSYCQLSATEREQADRDKSGYAHLWNISDDCFYAWFFPNSGTETWPSTIDLTDATACIRNVMRIVEKHHGPQDWLPLFPAEKGEPRAADMPTLDEFLKSIGIARPQVPAAQ